jgi:hypothetical protein
MAELKTKQNEASVEEFLNRITDERRRQDCLTILEIMKRVTGAPPKMWGDSMVGFGLYEYKYASGHSGSWALTGFSPRKQNLTLYLNCDLGLDEYKTTLSKLGKYKTGKSCLYINKLEDIDLTVLEELVKKSIETLSQSKALPGE